MLASPSVPVQYLHFERFIARRIQFQSGLFLAYSFHFVSQCPVDINLDLFRAVLTRLSVDLHEKQRRPENQRRSSQGNSRATCQYPASVQPFPELPLLLGSDSCTA